MKHRNTFLWKLFLQLAIIVLLLFYTINTLPAQTPKPAEAIAEKALAATVYLEMKDTNGKTLGIGSGFFVKPNLIATNYHVIEGAAKGTAKVVGKSTRYKIEGVTATDKTNDIALLKVTASGIKPLSLGDSDKVRIGETVYITGTSKGLKGTFSNGIISSKQSEDTKERLQMTAPISPGSRGGPMLNTKGEVIGVSFMTLEGEQNLNFAIPSETLKKLLKQSKLAKPLPQGKQSISAETYLLWGYAKSDLGYYVGAVKDYTAAIQLKPDDAEAYYNRGLAKVALGQHTAAISDFDKAIRLNPDYAEAYYNRGLTKRLSSKYTTAAISDFDKAIRLNPDYAEAYYNRGLAKRLLSKYTAAISDFDTAIRLNPDYAEAYYNRGRAKGIIGPLTAAISDYDTAIRLNPDYAEAYCLRGVLKDKSGQDTAAISDYDTAIRLNPDYLKAYINRGITKAALGQYTAAIVDFDNVIRLNPDDDSAYYKRGHLKNQLGQHAAAASDFNAAIQLKPDDAKSYLLRGLMRDKLGLTSAAQQDIRTALRLGIKGGDVDVDETTLLRILNK